MSYASISSQGSMALDGYRNALYAEAMRQVITPDSVVLDLGAGIGVHGLFAAAAGAKRVYLVEPQSVVQVAKEVARLNGLEEKVVVLQGTIEEVELPEPVDLIVSVFTGNLLYSEDLLPSLLYARDRYLKPGGHLIPDFAELMIAPVFAPELHAKYVSCWSDAHLGLDLSPLRRFAANEVLWLTREECQSERLAIGGVISAMDMAAAKHANCLGEIDFHIGKTSLCHGLQGWIKIKLCGRWLSTDPLEPRVHWSPVILPVDPPLQLDAGETVNVKLARPALGEWSWAMKALSGVRRHSSFMGRADGLKRLQELAPGYRPGISKKGVGVLRALELMREGSSNEEIARELAEGPSSSLAHPLTGAEDPRDSERPAFELVLHQVHGLAARYGAKK